MGQQCYSSPVGSHLTVAIQFGEGLLGQILYPFSVSGNECPKASNPVSAMYVHMW